MVRSLLKWLAQGASAGLVVAAAYLSGHAPAGVDPLVALLVLAGVGKLISFLVGKLPIPEP